jgi:predicted RNA methylase
MSYHQNLVLDQERLACFREAMEDIRGIVFDIGAGSGILTSCAAPYADFIYSVEKDPRVARKTALFLKEYDNVSFIEGDALEVDFPIKADYILCEMLDTALIDEEQVPVLNGLLKYLNGEGKVIPHGVINCIEPVFTRSEHICYDENETPHHQPLGPLNVYSQYQFGKCIDPNADFKLKMEIDTEGSVTGIKITTFTMITPEIICGPTPMMNPPLIIPIEKLMVKKGDSVKIDLSYQMGGGLNTIKTRTRGI